MAVTSFRDEIFLRGDKASETIGAALKRNFPTLDFDRMQIDYDPHMMQYRVAFMKGQKFLGDLRVEGADDFFSEVTVAKLMLMCG